MCPVPFYDVNFEHLVKVPPVCHFSPNITGSFPLHYKETFSFMLILKSTTQQRVIFLVYLVCSFFFVSLLNMCVHQGFIIGPLQFTTYVFFFCEFFHFCGFNHQSYLSTQILCGFQMHILNYIWTYSLKGISIFHLLFLFTISFVQPN